MKKFAFVALAALVLVASSVVATVTASAQQPPAGLPPINLPAMPTNLQSPQAIFAAAAAESAALHAQSTADLAKYQALSASFHPTGPTKTFASAPQPVVTLAKTPAMTVTLQAGIMPSAADLSSTSWGPWGKP